MRICVFGGSATWGEGDTVTGGWVTLLQIHLAKSNHYLYNLGVSGNTTNEMVDRAKPEMQSRKPNLVIFSIGLNDSALITPRMEPRVSIDKFNQNIATLYKKARELDARVVFIGPTTVVENKTTPIPWDTTKHYTVASALAFDNLLKKFCDRNKINFISLTSTLGTDDITGDGLHPNTSGHEKIYIKIKPHLEKIILDLAS